MAKNDVRSDIKRIVESGELEGMAEIDGGLSENQIVVYQPNETLRLDVRLENDTVWLNRHQMAQLFGRDVKTIGKHIANALSEELAQNPVAADFAIAQDPASATVAKYATVRNADSPVVAKFATTATDGKVYQVEYYSLDVILSVGYRVKSAQAGKCRRNGQEARCAQSSGRMVTTAGPSRARSGASSISRRRSSGWRARRSAG